jgi:hypothetical protein
VYGRTIRHEEATLSRLFGERFDAYRRAVPCLFPWRGPVRGLAPSRPFDWSNPNLARGREYSRVARMLTAPFVIALGATLVRGLRDGSPYEPRVLGTAALVVVLLEAVRRAALRRFKQGRSVLPGAFGAPAARGAALVAFAATGSLTGWFEDERAGVFVVAACLLAATWALVFAAPARLMRSPASRRLVEALSLLAAGFAAEQPWLGAIFAAWFAVLAMEASAEPERATPAGPGRVRQAALALARVAACASQEFLGPATSRSETRPRTGSTLAVPSRVR